MPVLFPGGAIKASVAAQYSRQSRGDVAARYSRSVLPKGSAQARASERANLGGIAGNPVPCYGAGFFIFRAMLFAFVSLSLRGNFMCDSPAERV